MTPPADLSTLFPSEKDALIAALLARVKALLEEVEGLRTEPAPEDASQFQQAALTGDEGER
jgi:hypothetical protein